jgi:hypothetical protein
MITFTRYCADVLCLELTDPQRVFCQVVFDRIEPIALDPADLEIARVLFGDVDTLPESARRVALGIFGRGSGKDHIGGAYALYRLTTADCSSCGIGDVPTFVIIAPDKGLATIALRRALALARSVPEIARMLERETADGFELRVSGRLVALEVIAASRAGSSARGRSILGALLSEAAFFRSDEASVSDEEIFNAIMPRLMSGGIICIFSTPYAESGLLFTLFEANHKKPKTSIVAQASSVFMRPDDDDLRARVAIEEERSPTNAAREYGAQFVGIGSSSWFTASTIDEAVDASLVQASGRDKSRGQVIAWDLGFSIDSSALVVCAYDDSTASIVHTRELIPRPGAPLSPTGVVQEFAGIHGRFGHYVANVDQHHYATIKELAAAHSLRLHQVKTHEKVQRHQSAKAMFDDGRVRLPKNPRLIQQFKDIVGKPQPGGGTKIYVPRRVGSAHGDVASAAIITISHVHRETRNAPQKAARARQMAELEQNLIASGFAGPPPGVTRELMARLERIRVGGSPMGWLSKAMAEDRAKKGTE